MSRPMRQYRSTSSALTASAAFTCAARMRALRVG
jgi:hypothetical protein